MTILSSFFRTPNSEVWRAKWLPYAKVKRENDQSFSGGGISIAPVEPMRVWTIDFQGTLQNMENGQERQVRYFILELLLVHNLFIFLG